MSVVLVEALPADPRTGATAPVRLAGGGQSAFVQMGHLDWLAGVADAPRFTAEYGFADGGWTGGAIPQTTPILFQPADPTTLAGLATRYWRDAPVRIWTQAEGADPVLVLTGTVAADAWTSGGVTLTVSDLGGALAKPFSTGRFEGKGGIDGDPDVAGREKRRSFGRVFNVEARLLLKAFNVYEVGDPSRPLQGIVVARDRGRAGPLATVAWAGSIAATLAALIAAEVPKGGAVVAPSIACIRCGVQPAAPLTVDLLGEIGAGYVETVPAIAQRIIAEAAPALTLRDPAEALALRTAPAGLHVSSTTETAAQLLDRMLLGVSLLWSVEADGGVRLRSWTFGTALPVAWTAGAVARPWTGGGAAIGWAAAVAAERLRSHGAQRLKTYRPTRSRRVGYRRNCRPQDTGEIAADILASDLTYADGTPIDALKPAQPGADVTGDHTSKDTNAVGGVPSDQIKSRMVDLEEITAPTGPIRTAIDGLGASVTNVQERIAAIRQSVEDVTADFDDIDDRVKAIRAEIDGAVAERLSTLTAQLAGTASSWMGDRVALAVTNTEALATAVQTLDAQMAGTSDSYFKTQIGLATDNISAVGTKVDTLRAEMDGTADSYFKAQIKVGAEATKAVGERVDTLRSQVAGTSDSYLKTEILAAAEVGRAVTERVDTLNAQIDGTAQSWVSDQITLAATRSEALVTATNNLSAQMAGTSDSYLKTQIALAADRTSAIATKVDTLRAEMDGTADSFFKAQITLGADATKAVGERVETLAGTVGTLNGTVTTQAGLLADISGKLTTYWEARAEAGDVPAFVTVKAELVPGEEPTSAVALGARAIYIYNEVDGTWLKAFAVEGGDTRVYGNLAVDGAVSMRNIKVGAVAPVSYAKTSAVTSCPRGVQTSVISYTFSKLDADSALEVQMYAHCYNQDDLDFIATMLLDGQVLQSPPIRMPFDNAGSRGATTVTPMAILEGVPAGDHVITFAMTSNETEGPTMVSAGAFLRVTELRAPSIATVIGNSGNGSQIGGGGGSGDPGDGGGGGSGGGGTGGGEVPIEA